MSIEKPATELAAEVLRVERNYPPDAPEGGVTIDSDTWSRMLGLALAVLGPAGVLKLDQEARRGR